MNQDRRSVTDQLTTLSLRGQPGNQGVNALCWSTLDGIAQRIAADVQVFSYGDYRALQVVPGSVPPFLYRLRDMSVGRRIRRANQLR
jgi:hypothetical protein